MDMNKIDELIERMGNGIFINHVQKEQPPVLMADRTLDGDRAITRRDPIIKPHNTGLTELEHEGNI